MSGKPVPIENRFWAKVNKTDTCWLWTAAARLDGYGVIGTWVEGKTKVEAAHRVSWRLAYGDVPDGLYVCHRCDVKLCVRPSHLFLGTPSDNIMDASAKGRHGRYNHWKTQCKWGHPFDAENTYVNRDGYRSCRACGREKMRRRRAA